MTFADFWHQHAGRSRVGPTEMIASAAYALALAGVQIEFIHPDGIAVVGETRNLTYTEAMRRAVLGEF